MVGYQVEILRTTRKRKFHGRYPDRRYLSRLADSVKLFPYATVPYSAKAQLCQR
jgi:hypothetical protein